VVIKFRILKSELKNYKKNLKILRLQVRKI